MYHKDKSHVRRCKCAGGKIECMCVSVCTSVLDEEPHRLILGVLHHQFFQHSVHIALEASFVFACSALLQPSMKNL